MAGHSKWNNIKHRKAAVDAKRGKLWSKISHLIIAAAKNGPDPNQNLALRYAIDKGRAANMPNDTIDKAILKGSGGGEGVNYQPVVYEGYGPGGVAIIVDALTDNPTRTAPEIKKLFELGGGKLGAMNCVSWNFQTKGVFTIASADTDEEKLMEIALEAGADDVRQDESGFEVVSEVPAFESVKKALADHKIKMQSAEITKLPGTTVSVDAASAQKIIKLIDSFEDHDDVQNVYSNFDMSAEVMASLQ